MRHVLEYFLSEHVSRLDIPSHLGYTDREIAIQRGEETFYADLETANEGELGFRCNESADQLLPKVVDNLRPVLTSYAGNTPTSVSSSRR